MASKRKAECTAEEWTAYLAKIRQYRLDNLHQYKARARAYQMRPDVRAKRLAQYNTPEAKAKKSAYHAKEEVKQRARERYKNAGKEKRERINAWQRRRRTGFSDTDVAALLSIQENKCAVCLSEIQGRNIKRDHCHTTGSPRGLLCHFCNIIEGMLLSRQMSPLDFGRRLHEYVANPPFLRLSAK